MKFGPITIMSLCPLQFMTGSPVPQGKYILDNSATHDLGLMQHFPSMIANPCWDTKCFSCQIFIIHHIYSLPAITITIQ